MAPAVGINSERGMRLNWRDLGSARVDSADGERVEINGFPAAVLSMASARHFILIPEASCCGGCIPRNPRAAVEVFAAAPLPLRSQSLRLTGTLRVQRDDPTGWRYQLHGARLREPPGWAAVTRRRLLATGPLMCLAACTGAADQQRQAEAQRAMAAAAPVDLHSHAGGIHSAWRNRSGWPFGQVAQPMRQGGMTAICLAIVADGGTTRNDANGHTHPYRDPDPGELYQLGQLSFSRVHDLARDQGISIIADAAGLRAARAGGASAIISAEGADFLEGRIERVDEAYTRWTLRHLQLTHFRVNELGDIQTEPEVHFGLTDFGADVVRRCNHLGIVVDVAHGTYNLVKRAASVASKPLILSHTSLIPYPRQYSRRITPDHARVIASTGGVIGVWPMASDFSTLFGLADGMARMVDVVGIDHVGLGTDMAVLGPPSIFTDYSRLPDLAEAMISVGFNATEASKLLGDNYRRVFEACTA
jgi:membrane dipeptidase